MEDLLEIYKRIEYLRNNGVKMKEMADHTHMPASVLSSLYSAVLPAYVSTLKKGNSAEEALDYALSPDHENHQVIIITAHFGNWEVAGEAFSEKARRPMLSMMRSFGNPLIGRMILAHRAGKMHELVDKTEGIRPVLRAINKGKNVTMLIDQHAAGSEGVVEIANYNCPGQLVIGGQKAAVDAAAAKAKELGAKRCLPLKVSGPFHTSLLRPAGDALRERFKTESFGEMAFPVLFNCLGREMGEGDTIPALLERQVQSSVYMEDTIRRLAELGVDLVVESGPGKVLSGFVKKTAPALKTCAVETCADIDALCALLKEEE